MEIKEYSNPEEAYKILNSWTQIKTSYKIKFLGKNVTQVKITYQGDQPRFASFNYKTKKGIGCTNIDLSKKILLERSEKPNIGFKFRKKN
jgi:hypothetical protein